MLKRPIITEKSLSLAERGVYSFAVNANLTRSEIAKAIEKIYGVKVMAVNLQSVKGKLIRRRQGKGIGKEKNWKKALVTLKQGQKITDFELEQTKEEKTKDKK